MSERLQKLIFYIFCSSITRENIVIYFIALKNILLLSLIFFIYYKKITPVSARKKRGFYDSTRKW